MQWNETEIGWPNKLKPYDLIFSTIGLKKNPEDLKNIYQILY